jgi:dethiobiotin synthetase
MNRTTLFITGTDTGVGKTLLTGLLARHLREAGVRVAALKPLCSGGREDAHALCAALGGALTVDQINPWHFRAVLAPLIAARREGQKVEFAQVLAWVRQVRREFEVTLIEGAGGLLSPLGEGFNARDLIAGLRAVPVVVCPNRLGAVNQALLVLAALPRSGSNRARVVLVNQPKPDLAARTNAALLAECLGPDRTHVLPWMDTRQPTTESLRRAVKALWRSLSRA